MKKLGLPLVIIAIWAVIFVAGPWYAGNKTEKRLDKLLQRMNTNGIVSFTKTAYDKGLFSSTVAITARIHLDALGPAAKTLPLAQAKQSWVLRGEVNHGPFLFEDGLAFAVGNIAFQPEMSPQQQQQVHHFFGSAHPLALNVRFNWDSSTRIDSSLTGFTNTEEGLSSEPARLVVSLSNNNTRMKSHFDWGGLKLEKMTANGKNSKLFIGAVSSDSEEEMPLADLWVGTSGIHLSQVQFSDEARGINAVADDFKVVSKTALDASREYLHGMVDITLKNITRNNVSYLDDFEYKLSFEHIHAASLQKLVKAIRETQRAGGSPEAMQMAMGMQMMGIIPDMVKKGFSVKFDALNGRVMGEQVISSFDLNLAEGTDVTAGMAAIMGVSAHLDATVSRLLFDKIPVANAQTLQGLIDQGLVIEDMGNLKTHAEFKNGQLKVNGKPMPIPGMPKPPQ